MGTFNSEKIIEISIEDLSPVAQDLITHFKEQGYEITGVQVEGGGWDVAITKGGMFKAALGLKAALNIEIRQHPRATSVKAGVKIFGRRAAPAAALWLVYPPALLGQVWGLIRQASLDDEAIRVVEASLTRRSRLGGLGERTTPHGAASPRSSEATQNASTATTPMESTAEAFCIKCGQRMPAEARFCGGCGERRPDQSVAR